MTRDLGARWPVLALNFIIGAVPAVLLTGAYLYLGFLLAEAKVELKDAREIAGEMRSDAHRFGQQAAQCKAQLDERQCECKDDSEDRIDEVAEH